VWADLVEDGDEAGGLGLARGGFHRRRLRSPVRPGFGMEKESNRGRRRETRFRPGVLIRRLCGCLVTSASKGSLPARGRSRTRRRGGLQCTVTMRTTLSIFFLAKRYVGWFCDGLGQVLGCSWALVLGCGGQVSFSLFFLFLLFSIFCFQFCFIILVLIQI
jgi:hypothetical protein